MKRCFLMTITRYAVANSISSKTKIEIRHESAGIYFVSDCFICKTKCKEPVSSLKFYNLYTFMYNVLTYMYVFKKKM